jgi:hypothetical protein
VENETDKAREYLKKYMGHVYHDYINNHLAGDFAYTLVSKITALESKLKAAEAENKSLKSIGDEYWQTLCHYDHDDISTPWPHGTGGNRQSSAIKQLKAAEDHAATMETCAKDAESELAHYKDAFKVVEAEMLKRVPFEVACEMCCHADTEDEEPNCNLCSKTPAPESCPLIPKVKTDD